MKNFEAYINDIIEEDACHAYRLANKNDHLECRSECFYCENKEKVRDWLLKENKEPIKLTEFEYDLLEIIYNIDKYKMYKTIKDWSILRCLKQKGYFKNVDEDMEIVDILNNCVMEVIEGAFQLGAEGTD